MDYCYTVEMNSNSERQKKQTLEYNQPTNFSANVQEPNNQMYRVGKIY